MWSASKLERLDFSEVQYLDLRAQLILAERKLERMGEQVTIQAGGDQLKEEFYRLMFEIRRLRMGE